MRYLITGENNLRNELYNREDVISDYVLAILNEDYAKEICTWNMMKSIQYIFNRRAVRCYENIGFEIKKKYCKDTLTGNAEFYLMEYNSVKWR